MADLKISSLPDASALGGGEFVPIVQGGQTRKLTVPTGTVLEQAADDVTLTGGAIDGVRIGSSERAIGVVFGVQVTVAFGDMAAAASKILVDAQPGEQYRIRDIMLSGAFTNFSGGSGNRNVSITDGTSTWSVMPAASLAALDNARWGATAVPWPAGKNLVQTSASGADIVAKYSGGTNDYTAGSMVLELLLERVA